MTWCVGCPEHFVDQEVSRLEAHVTVTIFGILVLFTPEVMITVSVTCATFLRVVSTFTQG